MNLKFGDLTLDGFRTVRAPFGMKIESFGFPRRHGSVTRDFGFLGPRIILLVGEVVKNTAADLDSYLDGLYRRLLELGKDKLYLRFTDRFIWAILRETTPGSDALRNTNLAVQIEMSFLCEDPFFWSTTVDNYSQLSVPTNPFTFSLANNGEAPTPMQIEIKAAGGNATDVKVTNTSTSLFVRMTGTILNGQTLVIDTDKRTMFNGASNALNDLGSGSSIHMELLRGTNNFQYDGPTGVNLSMNWTKRYLHG